MGARERERRGGGVGGGGRGLIQGSYNEGGGKDIGEEVKGCTKGAE
jgi:hypothetical protein